MPERKRVVIVGGGVGGAHAAKHLEAHADVTLIDPKDHFEIPYSGLRCIVEPQFAERSLILHSNYLKKAKHLLGSAESASATEVTTSSGQAIPYDYLVIATGSSHAGSTSRSSRIQHYRSENKKVKSAKTILIVGGGPVGVELAGEIITDFPEKKVVLVHSGSRLIEFLGPTASKKALNWLQSKNVRVYLDETVDVKSLKTSTGVYKTTSGKTIKANCHFVCVGKKLGNSWLEKSVVSDKLDGNGRLMVDKHLRVEGKTNIYAIGDITAIQEIKQGYLAQKHAQLVAGNIKAEIKGAKLRSYEPMASPFGIVSLGRRVGVAQFPFATIVGRVPAGIIKSKDLFVGSTRKGLGLKS